MRTHSQLNFDTGKTIITYDTSYVEHFDWLILFQIASVWRNRRHAVPHKHRLTLVVGERHEPATIRFF